MLSPEVLTMQIIAGGLLGTLGQGVRVIAGLKKANDSAAQQNQTTIIETSTLIISLFIGFTAGALALLATSGFTQIDISQSTAFALIAAGYAGTDFIEAFMKKYLPADTSKNAATTQTTATPSAAVTSAAAAQEHPAAG
ncbi:MAG: hypothetical protein PHP85_03590 [Gallionella sp.]|nr:hypothetical protein [Gallionella sp.]